MTILFTCALMRRLDILASNNCSKVYRSPSFSGHSTCLQKIPLQCVRFRLFFVKAGILLEFCKRITGFIKTYAASRCNVQVCSEGIEHLEDILLLRNNIPALYRATQLTSLLPVSWMHLFLTLRMNI